MLLVLINVINLRLRLSVFWATLDTYPFFVSLKVSFLGGKVALWIFNIQQNVIPSQYRWNSGRCVEVHKLEMYLAWPTLQPSHVLLFKPRFSKGSDLATHVFFCNYEQDGCTQKCIIEFYTLVVTGGCGQFRSLDTLPPIIKVENGWTWPYW